MEHCMPNTLSTQQNLANQTPKLAELTQQVLFGDIWKRPELSARERSIATVSALLALYRLEQLPFHLQKALDNGVDRHALGELITHLAFYAGWPAAVSAADLLASIPLEQ
jgi:4-carboxymuconolactone decarboxylase